MKVRVGFSTTNSMISRVIRWFTQAQVSHTYIRFYDEYLGIPLVIHADYPGVVILHADKFDSKNDKIEEFEIEDDKLLYALSKNLKHLGLKYDYWNIVNWALVLKFKRWFKRKIKHPTEDPKKLICVDLVARILNDADLTHLPVGDLHPKRLRKWFNENYQSMGWVKETF